MFLVTGGSDVDRLNERSNMYTYVDPYGRTNRDLRRSQRVCTKKRFYRSASSFRIDLQRRSFKV